ncbi:MAG: exonuclease SbcCD subunit D [Lachnospiraceae bacterium]|nr:exonuclease SbcCD subunit D [Lachnospiraceae bacterium]
MKFAHISDLHLGKRIHQFSMIEEQKYILQQIVDIVIEEKVDGVLIAGDIYDKIYPSAEAVALFDAFLVELAKEEIKVFVISGNHDSPERIAFLGQLTKKAGVYLAPVYKGNVEEITLEDEFGKVHIYLLPFIKPVHVRHFFPEESINTYTDAMRVVVKNLHLNLQERNVLVAHQFVAGATRSDSEEISVGGLDNVEVTAFEEFDYVALGHIHGPQNMGSEKVRYSGTPLKYSFSESTHKKSVTILELKQKGRLEIKELPLIPRHDLVKIRGTFLEVMNPENFPGLEPESFLHVTLVDEQDIPEAFRRLCVIYPNLMQMEYDNTRTRQKRSLQVTKEVAKLQPQDLFAGLYETMNNQPLSEIQKEYLMEKIEKIWKGEAK